MIGKVVVSILWTAPAVVYAWYFLLRFDELVADPTMMLAYAGVGGLMLVLLLKD